MKIVFKDDKVELTKEELTELLFSSCIRGEQVGAMRAEMKFNKDIAGLKQLERNPNQVFNNFIKKLYE